jgi:hypothetical protein
MLNILVHKREREHIHIKRERTRIVGLSEGDYGRWERKRQ